MNIDRNTIREEIIELIDKYVSEDDFVIGVLRYGAHLPHIYQNACNKRGRTPKRINTILSHMIGFFPPEFYSDKNFIILDDTIYEGVEMKRLISSLMESHGVSRERVKSATLVVHEKSKYLPDYPIPPMRLPDHNYVAWKEELASLVRRDIRPTERDHPLYYFEGSGLDLGRFISQLEDYGHLHPVGSDWKVPVFRMSLTIDSSTIQDLQPLEGIELDAISKLRFYWQQDEKGCRITIAPIVFAKLDISKFLLGSDQVLAKRCGLEINFFKSIYESATESARGQMLFYFVGRALAALLLHNFIAQIAPRLQRLGCPLRCTRPEQVDGVVNYIFPPTYQAFYNTIFNNIEYLIGAQTETDSLPFAEKWKRIPTSNFKPRVDPLLPEIYEILEFMTREADSARWSGSRWLPARGEYKGTTHRELVAEYKDAAFISSALDELLDSGLIRAMDKSIGQENVVFEREFLPGGEYNAVQVSRIADILRCEEVAVNPKLIKEESLELWGA